MMVSTSWRSWSKAVPHRSTGQVSTTSSPSTRCMRSWYATVGSMKRALGDGGGSVRSALRVAKEVWSPSIQPW